jgi:phosphoenolpyruvate carboxylase
VKPNPFDEAVSLIWYLRMFYHTYDMEKMFFKEKIQNSLIKLGFWPGDHGDPL